MRRKKGFEFGKGKYYFTIVDFPNNITMHRLDKESASRDFLRYKALGKNVEWLGKWDGKNFQETKSPQPVEVV